MRRAWIELVARFGVAEEDAFAVIRDLELRHADPARHYHTLEHVREVLATIDLLDPAGERAAARLAGWLHDVVYDPRADDNEERSAAFAETTLARLGLPAPTVATVARLIRRTRDHDAPPDDIDASILLDADLAILGAPPERYAEYASAIRREYAWVPVDRYRSGRCQVLRNFLDRPRIYRTAQMRGLLEASARRNLEAEIARLSP